MRKCPDCGFDIINDNAKYCKRCGAKLPTSECQTDEDNNDMDMSSNDDVILSEKPESPKNNNDVEEIDDTKFDSNSKIEDVREEEPEQKSQASLGETDGASIPSVYTSEWLKSNTQIKGWLIFFLSVISIGGVGSAINAFTNFDAADYGGNIWISAVDVFVGVSLLAIAIYTVYAFVKRKPNALFYGRLYVFLVFATNIISAIGGDLELGTLKTAIRGVVWSIIWFFYLLLSDQVQRIIPKSFRKVKASDWGILTVLIMIPVFCIVIGCVKLNSNDYSMNGEMPMAVDDSVAVDEAVADTVAVDMEDDVEEAEVESPEVKNLRLLKADIEESNKSCPMDIEEGLTIKKMYMDGDYVIYYVVCDEDVVDMDVLSQNKSKLRRIIKKNLNNADADVREFKRMCKKANKGIGYKYVGDTSEKSFSIRFSSSEL